MRGRAVEDAGRISKRYLFFLRHFNDTDNITPIIHAFLSANPGHRAEVLLYDENYCGHGDPNLSLLTQAFPGQFSWSWLGKHFGLDFERSRRATVWQQRLRRLLRSLAPAQRRHLDTTPRDESNRDRDSPSSPSSRPRAMGRWLWQTRVLRSIADVRSGRAGEELIRERLAPLVNSPRPADLVIFDVVRSHHVQGVLNALRSLGCQSIICLPVSPLINYNVLREVDFTTPGSREFMNRHDYSGFNALSFVDGLYLESYRAFMKALGLKDGLPQRAACIGSLRYNPQWIRIRETAAEATAGPRPERAEGGRTTKRLLVLVSRLKTNVNTAELQACLDWLAQAKGFDIRVKGHTRAARNDGGLQLHTMKDVSKEDTSALIDWSDAIVFWGTSAALEGYTKGKTMVCLPFLSSNLNLYAHYQAGFIARCRDDLVLFLSRYAQTGTAEPYNQAGIETLIKEVVQAGHTSWKDHRASTLRYLADNERPLSSIREAR